jgi:hypothetical protein
MLDLRRVACELARSWERADPVAPVHPTYGKNGVGIGPYDEKPFVAMLLEQLRDIRPYYQTSVAEVPYPGSRETVDFCLGMENVWDWAVELKYARMKRSNGTLEGAALSRVLSPYQESALVDCAKVLRFTAARARAVVLVAYDYPDVPVAPLVADLDRLPGSGLR